MLFYNYMVIKRYLYNFVNVFGKKLYFDYKLYKYKRELYNI